MAQRVPSSGDDLEGMMIDVQYSLEQSRLLTPVYVKTTGDPDRMIDAICQPASEALTIPEVVAELERLWMEELRYQHFEAHEIRPVAYQEALDFITVSQHGGFYVTGRLAVDISKIHGPIKTVTFCYRLTGRGSSEADVTDGVETATLTAQFLSDALGDLARAVLALLQGTPRSRCSWQEEPGEYRWLFEQRGEHLRIEILWFEDTFSHQSDERGKLIFQSECQLRQFAFQVRGELQRL